MQQFCFGLGWWLSKNNFCIYLKRKNSLLCILKYTKCIVYVYLISTTIHDHYFRQHKTLNPNLKPHQTNPNPPLSIAQFHTHCFTPSKLPWPPPPPCSALSAAETFPLPLSPPFDRYFAAAFFASPS